MMYGYTWDPSTPLVYAQSILPILLIGMITTIKAALAGYGIALVIGLAFALLKRSRSRAVRWTTSFIVEFLRDTPLLAQLFFLYFVLPDFGIRLPPFLTGALALGLQYSAYTAEVYRGGIEAVARGQWEAARALNLTPWTVYKDVVIPQAIPRIIPGLGNYLVAIFKETPVLLAISIVEMVGLAVMIGQATFEYVVPISMAGALFLILTIICSWLVGRIERAMPKAGIPMR